METNLKLGNNLRYYRNLRGLTLKEMSDKLDITLGTYQKYETGKIKHVDIDIVKQFAEILDVSPSVLLGWEEINKTNGTQNDEIKEIISNSIDKRKKAQALYEKFENAIPEIRDAVERLLKSPQ